MKAIEDSQEKRDLKKALELLKQAKRLLKDGFKAFGTFNEYNVELWIKEANQLIKPK